MQVTDVPSLAHLITDGTVLVAGLALFARFVRVETKMDLLSTDLNKHKHDFDSFKNEMNESVNELKRDFSELKGWVSNNLERRKGR